MVDPAAGTDWVQVGLQVLLGLGSVITAILGALFWRETRRQKQADATKTEAEAGKTEEETHEIANKAAQINEIREREREQWWQRQFGALREEFETERELSVARFQELNALERYLGALLRYVHNLVRRLRYHGEDVEDPPSPPNGTVDKADLPPPFPPSAPPREVDEP